MEFKLPTSTSNIGGEDEDYQDETILGFDPTTRTHSIPLTKSMVALIKRNITEDSEYVFRGYQGRETLGDFKKSWNRVKAVAGVSCRWHDFRHTCLLN